MRLMLGFGKRMVMVRVESVGWHMEGDDDDTDGGEPQRETALDALTERADPNPPSEVSVPMGFQPIYYEEDHK